MNGEIQHWETSPAVVVSVLTATAQKKTKNPRDATENWHLPLMWLKSISKGCNTAYETKTCPMVQPHCQYFDYYIPLLKNKPTHSFHHQSLQHEAWKNNYTKNLRFVPLRVAQEIQLVHVIWEILFIHLMYRNKDKDQFQKCEDKSSSVWSWSSDIKKHYNS